jgi:competence protein ComEA
MATAAEKQALGFLIMVALVGAAVKAVGVQRFEADAVRAARAAEGGVAADTSLGERALARQLVAIDSARSAPRVSRGRKKRPEGGTAPARAQARESIPAEPVPILDVNAATAAELERLPRVGPALAQRIVAWREQHGPFAGPDDLRHVRGIGPSTVRLLLPLVTFSDRHRPLLSEDFTFPASFLTTPFGGHPGTWQLPQLH